MHRHQFATAVSNTLQNKRETPKDQTPFAALGHSRDKLCFNWRRPPAPGSGWGRAQMANLRPSSCREHSLSQTVKLRVSELSGVGLIISSLTEEEIWWFLFDTISVTSCLLISTPPPPRLILPSKNKWCFRYPLFHSNWGLAISLLFPLYLLRLFHPSRCYLGKLQTDLRDSERK